MVRYASCVDDWSPKLEDGHIAIGEGVGEVGVPPTPGPRVPGQAGTRYHDVVYNKVTGEARSLTYFCNDNDCTLPFLTPSSQINQL